uniref:Putative sialidase n=2 Tax=Tetraselmis sp. GSL018 TaxID=582737 RepID=A0A061QQS6_9CHLO|mmetsp:Transcript_30760/g.73247  ORF Transcript_30760/g.73247 Transcript_30760/m.73247 type:complete len:683 (+) Transcript_30760:245-2293(+)
MDITRLRRNSEANQSFGKLDSFLEDKNEGKAKTQGWNPLWPFNWFNVISLFGLALFLYIADPGTNIAMWRLQARYSKSRKAVDLLPDLDRDPGAVSAFSTLLSAEADFDEMVGSFESSVKQFDNFGKELVHNVERRQRREKELDLKAQEREDELQRRHKREDTLESLFLSSKRDPGGRPRAPQEEDPKPRQAPKGYDFSQIVEASSLPLEARRFVDRSGHVLGAIGAPMVLTTALTADEQSSGSLQFGQSPSLVSWKPGDYSGRVLVAAWQGVAPGARGTVGGDGQPIMWSFSSDGGKNWQEPARAITYFSHAAWTPQLHVDTENRLWMFFTRSRICASQMGLRSQQWASGGDVMATVLRGLHSQWGEPMELLMQGRHEPPFQISSKPIFMQHGSTVVLPFWTERHAGQTGCPSSANPEASHSNARMVSSAGVLVSADKGETWTTAGRVQDVGVPLLGGTVLDAPIMAALKRMVPNNELVMFLRSTAGSLFRTSSLDLGRTWTFPTLMQMPNPNAKIEVMKFQPNGTLIMAFNNHPVHQPKGMGPCINCLAELSLATSFDMGITWNLLSTVDGTTLDDVAVAAPSIEQVSESEIGVLYVKSLRRNVGRRVVPGIYFSRMDASALQAVPAHRRADGPGRAHLSASALRRVIDHFLASQKHSAVLRLKYDRPTWEEICEALWKR